MSEFKRFFQSKMPLLWAAVLLLNAVLLLGAHSTNREAAHIAETVMKNAETMEGETAFDRVTNARAAYIAEYKETHEKIADAVKDGLNRASEQAQAVDNYRNTVENRIKESERALKSGFYRTGSAEWTSLQAGLRDQRAYLNYTPALIEIEWLDVLLSYLWTPVLLLAMLIFTVLIFFHQSQRGLRPVLFVTKNGRAGLFVRRLVLLILEAFVGAFLLYGESAAVLIYIYGGGADLNAPAISLSRLIFNAGSLSSLQYLIRVALFSFAGALILSLIAWVCGSFIENRAAAILLFFVIFGIEYLLYRLISVKTVFRFLHYLNIYSLLFPMEALAREYWGYDLGVQLKSVSVLLTGGAIGVAAVVFLLKKSLSYEGGRTFRIPWFEDLQKKIMKTLAEAPTFLKEVRRALISERSLVGIAILLIVILNLNVGHRVFYDDSVQAYLKGFYEKAYGLSASPELNAIEEEYEQAYQEAIKGADPDTWMGQALIQNQTMLIEAIRREVSRYSGLSEKGISARVMNPYDYQAYLGSPQEMPRILITLSEILAAVLISMSCFSYERSKHMNQLIAASKERKKWFVRKLSVRLVLNLLFILAAEGIYFLRIIKIYEFTGLSFPLKSMALFEGFITNPPVIVFLAGTLLLKIGLLSALTVFTAILSAKLKGQASAAAVLIAIVPSLFFLLGIRSLRNVSAAHYFAVIPWILKGTAIRLIGLIAALALIGAVIVITVKLVKEQERKGITCG